MTATMEKGTGLATVIAYPVCDDGLLVDDATSGQLTGLDGQNMRIRLDGGHRLRGTSMLVGVTCPDRTTGYVGMTIQKDQRDGDGHVMCGVRGGIAEQVLAEESRYPLLTMKQFRFELPFSQEVYLSWVQARILRRRPLDKVLLCPHCSALPTFRYACRRCGSGRLHRELLVHHFACAYVAPLAEFHGEKSLCCPKCQTRHLAAGTDLEYIPGAFTCQDCGWVDHELEQTGHCLHCESRFPLHQAVEVELVGYDADRLDALALVPLLG